MFDEIPVEFTHEGKTYNGYLMAVNGAATTLPMFNIYVNKYYWGFVHMVKVYSAPPGHPVDLKEVPKYKYRCYLKDVYRPDLAEQFEEDLISWFG